MKIGAIVNNDLANGIGVRTSVFVSGCSHHCVGCHNPELWNYDIGKEISSEIINTIIECLQKDGIRRGLSILGGEPLDPENVAGVALLIRSIKEKIPDINIWVWTGYKFEELKARKGMHTRYILSNINTLIDGQFVKDLKSGYHPWRGSSNQNIITFMEKDETN